MTTPLPQPGWYPDPDPGAPGQQRYFDGTAWTESRTASRPVPVQPNAAAYLHCPRCHSNNVRVQAVEKVQTKKRGCFAWLLWMLLAILTIGLILLIYPLVTNSKTTSTTEELAVCQDCGRMWKI